MKLPLLLSLLMTGLLSSAQPTLVVGSYTQKGNAGIHTYRFDAAAQTATPIDSAKCDNASYLALSGKNLYAVNETGKTSRLSAFAIRKGKLTFLNSVDAGGDDPCYVTVDAKGRNVLAGNYSSGSVTLFSVAPDGGIGPNDLVFTHNGSGPNKQRQEAPHVHSVNISPDGDYVLVADLGIDKIVTYRLSSNDHKLTPTKKILQLTPGSGPRHLAFHPNEKWVYIIGELAGSITACTYKKGELRPFEELSMMPAGSTAAPHAADIHISPDGRFLYASNRQPTNTIAIFGIDRETGKLTLVAQQSTGGAGPRNFSLDPTGTLLLAANQDSDNIVIFKVDKETGLLTDTGKRIDVASPVCLKWTK